ncbi:MAG: cation diffusion facilitator family transporter [Candidatus Promineifilaceae bacterium]|nr:cation diffusion facilitator family transporter [Candidatus Promineifilaceae bacterium]
MNNRSHHDGSRDHEHDLPEHGHGHKHEHDHDHSHGFWEQLAHLLPWRGHSHDYTELAGDEALQSHEEGIRTIWLALGALLLTTVIQVVIVFLSGSVALLADTVHNLGDGLNSIPLLIAFYLARWAATRRYSYGFGRAEDVAGIFIVLSIAISAGVIFWESFQKFLDPEPIANLPWVVAASIVGFLGNEAVALLQIRVGRKIGSAAMVADGLHARTDGLTSLAVLLAAGGSWLGYPIVDPIIGTNCSMRSKSSRRWLSTLSRLVCWMRRITIRSIMKLFRAPSRNLAGRRLTGRGFEAARIYVTPFIRERRSGSSLFALLL